MARATDGGVPGGRLLANDWNEPPPVAAAAPNLAAMFEACAAGTCTATRALAHPVLKLLVTMAPSSAIPNTPPISRLVLVAADATPACRVSTDPITAAVIGVMVDAIPPASTRNAGSRTVKYGEPGWVRSSSASPPPATNGPNVMNHREPYRSESRPARGATTRMTKENASSRTPAPIGE